MPESLTSSSATFAACHGSRAGGSAGRCRTGTPSSPSSRRAVGFGWSTRIAHGALRAAEVGCGGCGALLVAGGYPRSVVGAGARGRLVPATSSNLAPESEQVAAEADVLVETGGQPTVSLSGATVHFLEERDEGVLSKRMLSLSRSNKVRGALEVFVSMTAAGLRPGSHACNSLLACLVRNGSLDDALRVFEMMRKRRMATGHTFSLILKAVAEARGFDSAVRLFMEVEAEGMAEGSFDVIVHNTVISMCARERNWLEAERMWTSLKKSSCSGTMVTYRLLVSTFVQCGQAELALCAYNEMIHNGLQPDEDVMKAMIAVCTKDGKWELGLTVFRQMLDSGIQPNAIAYNAMISCLGKAGESELAFKIYDLMRSSGHSPDVFTWNALLSALYRCRKYADALRLFESIMRENSELNVHLYNIALMSCQRLGLWDHSLQLLWKMEKSEILVPTASYNLVIHACEHAKQPKVALQVYQHMIHKRCIPDTFTYLSLIRACIWGSLWNEVEEILKRVAPNASLYNAVIHGFCLRGKITSAKKLYSKMRSSGLEADGKTRAFMLQHFANDRVRQNMG
uniref:Pentatricopeptide repeat-containing protein At3g29290 n=1 Tax=Anthurium amnicola TaxID=1678845 RepID=A0A1D1ZH29_9ARAE